MTTIPVESVTPRRALATRHAGWARRMAGGLARLGVRPNAVSVAGVGVAAAASAALVLAPRVGAAGQAAVLVAAAAGIQLRLLCNLLDGMLAVEEGLKTKTGDIYNDLPDRVADVLLLVGAGYSIRRLPYGVTLGWAAALLALFTAYVRVLAGSLGLTQRFIGPMAKQHRMFALTLVTLLAAVEAFLDMRPRAMAAGLALIAAGSVVTLVRRIHRLLDEAGMR